MCARLHLGKNELGIIAYQASLGHQRAELAGFHRAVDELDPEGVFANDFLRAIGLRWTRAGSSTAPPD